MLKLACGAFEIDEYVKSPKCRHSGESRNQAVKRGYGLCTFAEETKIITIYETAILAWRKK
jgi:hypothetical protein